MASDAPSQNTSEVLLSCHLAVLPRGRTSEIASILPCTRVLHQFPQLSQSRLRPTCSSSSINHLVFRQSKKLGGLIYVPMTYVEFMTVGFLDTLSCLRRSAILSFRSGQVRDHPN